MEGVNINTRNKHGITETQDYSYNQAELLNYIVDNSIIDLMHVQEKIDMKKREEILKKHCYTVWYNEKDGFWRTHLPDETQTNGRRKIKRKKKEDLETAIYDYYLSLKSEEEKHKEIKDRNKVVTVEDLFFEFMSHKVKEVSSGTIKRMMADWDKFYKTDEKFISIKIAELTKVNMDDCFNSVLNKYSLKKKAFYNMCGVIKQALEYAVDSEYLQKNPYRIKANKKKFVSSNKKPAAKEVYQVDERKLFLDEMERRLRNNPSNTAPLAVMLDFELGTRKGEILALTKSDIEGNRIHIHRQLVEEFDIRDLEHIKSKGYHVVEYTKSEDGDRWRQLTDTAKEIIRRVEKINNEYGFSFKDLLFVKESGYMSPDAIDSQIKRGCEYIGLPVKTMHKIRKTYASTLLHNGVNISIVKDMLGHADEATTLRHYIYNIENDEETDDLVRAALAGKKNIKIGNQIKIVIRIR